MSKHRAHERQLQRARDKRRAERRRHDRRRRLLASVVVGLLLLGVAGGVVAVVAARQPTPPVVDDPDATPRERPTDAQAAAVACDGTVPPAAAADKPTYDAPPEMVIDPQRDYRAVLDTSCGTITVDLLADRAPRTVNNFVFLAREDFYDGVTFHRVIDGFVVQGGDPEGTGAGGPGYAFEDELAVAQEQGYPVGAVAMANSGPNTNGSQFFIVLPGGGEKLTPDYSLFGQVVEGMEVAEAIAAVPTDQADRPTETVYIEDVTIEEAPDG